MSKQLPDGSGSEKMQAILEWKRQASLARSPADVRQSMLRARFIEVMAAIFRPVGVTPGEAPAGWTATKQSSEQRVQKMAAAAAKRDRKAAKRRALLPAGQVTRVPKFSFADTKPTDPES